MANNEGLRARKKQKTRDLLIDIALRLFLEKGYEETTIEEIAAAAEVSPRTFFRYFPTKEDVVFLDQNQENALLVEMIAARDPNEEEIDSLLRATAKLFDLSLPNFAHNPRLFEVVLKTPSLLNKTAQLMVFVEELIVKGLMSPNPTPAEARRIKILAAIFIGGLRAAFIDWTRRGMPGTPYELLQEFGSLLKNGFQRPDKHP